MTVEDRSDYKKIQVWVPLKIWNKLISMGYSSPTETVLKGLQLLTIESQNTPMSLNIGDLKARVEEKDARIRELQEQMKVNDIHQQNRINDLKAQIQTFHDQLKVKDEQLHAKDEQIKDQNENMHKQAVHIQSLIQENSRLNIKLLPENAEKSKPWWRFW
jgi:septal ring factor EnvC (AmiA/AmiB activator)